MLYLSCSCTHICKRLFNKRKAKSQYSLKKVYSTTAWTFWVGLKTRLHTCGRSGNIITDTKLKLSWVASGKIRALWRRRGAWGCDTTNVFKMEFNRCLGASAEEEKGRQEGGEEDINNAGSSAAHEELDWVQMYLTCLPEQYMKVKFTLTAYLTCWLLLKLCKVRSFSTSLWYF